MPAYELTETTFCLTLPRLQVHLVRGKKDAKIYALKMLNKWDMLKRKEVCALRWRGEHHELTAPPDNPSARPWRSCASH